MTDTVGIKNPSFTKFWSSINKAEEQMLRGILYEGDLYVWDSSKSLCKDFELKDNMSVYTHKAIAQAAGIKSSEIDVINEFPLFWFTKYAIYISYPIFNKEPLYDYIQGLYEKYYKDVEVQNNTPKHLLYDFEYCYRF